MQLELALVVLVFFVFEFVIPAFLSSHYSKQFFERHLSDAFNYPVTFERMNTHLLGAPTVLVSGFKIFDRHGQSFFNADDAEIALSPWALVRGKIVLTHMRMRDGAFTAFRLPDKQWNIADLVGAGNDPDQAIDLEKTAVDLQNIVVTFYDQALAIPVIRHIRLRDFSISSLDLRRKTILRMDAIDEDHPESTLALTGNFTLYIPDDLSTMNGHLEAQLKGFDLEFFTPYLQSAEFPVNAIRGSYDLDVKMSGQGRSPLDVDIQSTLRELQVATKKSGLSLQDPQKLTKMPAANPPVRMSDWVNLNSASLAGRLELTADELKSDRLEGAVASAKFEIHGRLFGLQNGTPRVDAELVSRDFSLEEPLRTPLRSILDSASQRLFDSTTGTGQGQLSATGKISDPVFAWRFDLKKGEYRDASLPLVLRDVFAELRSNGPIVQLDFLRARYGNSPLEVSGWMQLPARMDVNVSAQSLSLAQVYPLLVQLRTQMHLGSLGWLDEVKNVNGQAQAKLHLTGNRSDPKVTGTIDLARVYMQPRVLSAPVENLKGQIDVEPQVLRMRQLSGSLGDSPFDLDMSLDPASSKILEMNLHSENFDLRHFDELVKAHWIDPISLPGMGRLEDADGKASLALTYRGDNTSSSLGSQDIFAVLPKFSVEFQNANARFSRWPLRAMNFTGRLSFEDDPTRQLVVDHLKGRLGDSDVEIDGRVDHWGLAEEDWNIYTEGDFVMPQAMTFLPTSWQSAVHGEGPISLNISAVGPRSQGVHVNARMSIPPAANLDIASVATKPPGAGIQMDANGVWTHQKFSVSDGKLLLRDVSMNLAGSVSFPEAQEPQLDVTASIGQFAPVTTLVQFVRLPDIGLNLDRGLVSGSVTLQGSASHPAFTSSLRLADVGVRGMPWGATSLTGDIAVGSGSISAKDFLAIVGNVPMRITGDAKFGKSHSEVDMEVANINLDALVATLVRMSSVAEEGNSKSSHVPMTIHMRASSGVVFHQPIRSFSADGSWENGILTMDPMRVETADSSTSGHVTWNSLTNEQHMEFEARQVPLSPFLDEVLDLQLPVEGKLDVDANLTSRNPDPKNLLGSFQGHVSLRASDGTLEHAGLPQRLLSMAAMVHEGLFGFNLGRIFQTIDPPTFKTFKHFSAAVTFPGDGTARLDQGEFKSDLFDLNATGKIQAQSEEMQIVVNGSMPEIPRSSNLLAQVFGRISILDAFRNVRDFSLLIAGQGKRIKPRRHYFEFKLTGNLEGIKSIENFHFVR